MENNETMATLQLEDPFQPKAKNHLWKIFAGTAIVLIGALGITFAMRLGPLLQVQRALGNFNQEVVSRVETTPLQAINLLADNFTNGTTHVTLAFEDTHWEDTGVFNMEIISTEDGQVAAIHLDFMVESPFDLVEVDLTLLVSTDQVLMRSSLLGSNYYGVALATFAEDFAPLATELGLDQFTIDMIVEYVENLHQSMANASEGESALDEALLELIETLVSTTTDFVRDIGHTSSRVNGANRVEFAITGQQGVDLLQDLLGTIRDNQGFRDYMESYFESIYSFAPYLALYAIVDMDAELDLLAAELDELLDDMIDIELVLALYIGSRRLNRATLDIHWVDAGEPMDFNATISLGETALDTWYASLTFDGETVQARWEIDTLPGGHRNTIAFISPASPEGGEDFALTSTLENGRFNMGYRTVRSQGNITGDFATNNGGFTLRLDEIAISTMNFNLSMDFAPGGDIVWPTDYVNIRQWDMDLIESWLDSLFNLMW